MSAITPSSDLQWQENTERKHEQQPIKKAVVSYHWNDLHCFFFFQARSEPSEVLVKSVNTGFCLSILTLRCTCLHAKHRLTPAWKIRSMCQNVCFVSPVVYLPVTAVSGVYAFSIIWWFIYLFLLFLFPLWNSLSCQSVRRKINHMALWFMLLFFFFSPPMPILPFLSQNAEAIMSRSINPTFWHVMLEEEFSCQAITASEPKRHTFWAHAFTKA